MKILIVDQDGVGLSYALRAYDAGHQVRWFIRPKPSNSKQIGSGFKGIEKVENWVPHVSWADLIFSTSNDEYIERLAFFKAKGFPVFAPSPASAKLEISRADGMKALEAAGIECAPYKTFKTMQEAEKHVIKSDERFVFKTLGDNEDKALTYVSKSPADLVAWMRRTPPPKGEVMLQTFIDGIEMGVSRFMGKAGWVGQWNESFEHKKLMASNYGPNCYSIDSEVLTESGWKFWPDVTTEDKICTLKKGKIEFELPSQLVAAPFRGEMCSWKSPNVDFLVTPGHSMYVTDGHGRNDFFFESADLVSTQTRKVLRAGEGEWIGRDDSGVLPKFYSGSLKDWAALVGMFIADGYAYGRRLVFGNCPEHKHKIFAEIAKCAGYELLKNESSSYIESKDLVEYFSKYGRSWEKYCPQYIKSASSETIKSFLYGYGTGDGSFTRAHNNLTYWTVSKTLADDLQEMCLKIGFAANVKFNRGRDGNRDSYSVKVSQQKLMAKLTPDIFELVQYDDMVYCCTVTSHIIYVRRNGCACWCGQTGEMGTVAYFTETSKLGSDTLGKLEKTLLKLGHSGDTALGFIIDEKGKPWPTEWTCRLGWPIANMMLGATEGDPVSWMKDALNGKDTTTFAEDIGVCLVMAHADFPHGQSTKTETHGVPVYGITRGNKHHIHPQAVQMMRLPTDGPNGVHEKEMWATAGDYVAVITGFGKSVSQAAKRAYGTVKTLQVSNPLVRDDIGETLKKQLPILHSQGYALHCQYA